jgi:hypothetical protein
MILSNTQIRGLSYCLNLQNKGIFIEKINYLIFNSRFDLIKLLNFIIQKFIIFSYFFIDTLSKVIFFFMFIFDKHKKINIK